ncbi:Rieske (2Fe-2S) protein [Roseicella frigidaeris]|uniref:Rieske (2Fe-2S) protein n=1 Tax=Roseicella frigidaeris TaxID=2230885 RepID=A0A327MLS7_9PROT|nr:nitrite reductase (NAD(P)H) small subunit [Roseicella frigidaeris]RAI61088.1 Rieske (2Fe-2S) protein [Roseicella frigidaeris]
MEAERVLCRLADIPPGEGRTFEVGGERIAVFHTRAGGVFATAADCPHKAGPMADGLVGGTTVTCPLHERVYDLRSGKELSGECDIAVYPVRLSADGQVVMPAPVAAVAG